MCRDGMREAAGRFHLQLFALGDHPAEQRDIQGIEVFVQDSLRSFDQLLSTDGGWVKVLVLGKLGERIGLMVAYEEQRFFGQNVRHSFTAGGGLFLVSACSTAGCCEERRDELGAVPEGNPFVTQAKAYVTLPALGADSGSSGAADDGCLRRTDIIPVQTGYWEGLQDVELDALALHCQWVL
ncbi:hypothetical protein EMIT0194MI4_10640 [Pseudomonas sp. IT-194MI4]